MRNSREIKRNGCSFDLINRLGVKAVVNIMKDYNYNYGVELFKITDKIQKRYTLRQRERYGIDFIYEVKEILIYIKKNKLLERE